MNIILIIIGLALVLIGIGCMVVFAIIEAEKLGTPAQRIRTFRASFVFDAAGLLVFLFNPGLQQHPFSLRLLLAILVIVCTALVIYISIFLKRAEVE